MTSIRGLTGTVWASIRALGSEGRGSILLAVAGGWFLSIGIRMIYPVMLPHLRAAYGLDLTTAGLLLTVMFLAYAIGQLPGGVLADRFGEGRIMVLSTVIALATVALVVTANSAIVLFVATGLFGFGTGLFAVSRFTALADIYPDHVGTAFGVINAASDAGQAVLPAIAGFLAVALAWQFGFGFTIPLLALVAIAIWIAVPARTSEPDSAVDTLSRSNVRYILGELRHPSIIIGTMLLILGHVIWQAFTGFFPTYLTEVKGISGGLTGLLFGAFFAFGVVLKPLAGVGYDRIGSTRSLIALMGTTAVGLAVLPFVEGFWAIVGVTALISGVLGYSTIMSSYVTTALPQDMRGTGLGTVRTVYWTVSSASPVLFGALADRGYFDEGFLVLAGVAMLMVLLALALPAGDGGSGSEEPA